jgi:hypothetical protein
MAIRLEAPYPLVETTSFLPNPSFSDSEGLTEEIVQKRTMNGRLYTYVKTKSGRRRLLLSFTLDRMKGLELRAFFRSYYYSKIKLTDHLGISWIGYFTSNPFEFETNSKERQNIQIEFEGIS